MEGMEGMEGIEGIENTTIERRVRSALSQMVN